MIIIIGAGLSGLLTGYLLKKEGIPFKILEARDRVGGRIHTIYGTSHTPLEMGATWFTHQHTYLMALLKELKIEHFTQNMDRTVFFQASPHSPIQTVNVPPQDSSYRISGGTAHLINTLVDALDQNDILLNYTVKGITIKDRWVEVISEEIIKGTNVVLALPPKLWANNIKFTPKLPAHITNVAKQTHTWMENSIKVALTYSQPFWQEENKPATLFSQTGPITEFYDHCNHKKSKYALCGFINSSYKNLTVTERKMLVIAQIKKVYGFKAEDFMDYKECVWSTENYTFEASPVIPHQNNGNPVFREPLFNNTLLISGSETALEFPGYMEGALCAAYNIAKQLKAKQQRD